MDQAFPRNCLVLVPHVALRFYHARRPTQGRILRVCYSEAEIQPNQNNRRIIIIQGQLSGVV